MWKPWLAAGLWLGLIAFESTNALSAEKTGSLLYPLLHFLLGLDPVRFLTEGRASAFARKEVPTNP